MEDVCSVLDEVWYKGVPDGHVAQPCVANQRSEDPVSRITGNDLPGVPTVTVPM